MEQQVTATLPTATGKSVIESTLTAQPTSNPLPVQTQPTPPAQPEPAASQQDDKFASKFAALSRKEKAIFEREQAIKDREAKYTDWDNKRKLAKENPLEYIKAADLTYDQLTDFILSGKTALTPKDEAGKVVEQKLKEFEEKQKQADDQRKREDLDKQYKVFQETAVKTIKDAGEKYELINSTGRYDLIFEVIQEWFNDKQDVLPVDKAAEMVENYIDKEFDKIKHVKKILSKFQAQPQTEPKEPENKTTPKQAEPNTLTNNLNASQPVPENRLLTREESLARAAAKIKFV